MKAVIEDMHTVVKWDAPMYVQLLAGKFLSRVKSLINAEKRILNEPEPFMQGRFDSLIEFFRNSNTAIADQMILNSLETYKKLLLSDPEFQNNISWEVLETLIEALLLVFCHRKDYDHLNSMVSVVWTC